MGALPSILPNQRSVLQPGSKSVISAPLQAYVDEFDTFFHLIVDALKDPRHKKWQIWANKDLQLEPHGSEDFTIRVTWDGPKAQQLGFGDGQDRTYKATSLVSKAERRIDHFFYDRLTEKEKNEAREHALDFREDSEGFSNTDSFHLRFLSDPLRLEGWRMRGGRRHAGALLASVMGVWVNGAILEHRAPVKVFHDVESVDGGGLSVISEALDEVLSFDAFWEQIQDILRSQLLKDQRNAQVRQLSEMELEVIFQCKNPGLDRLERRPDAPKSISNHVQVKMDPAKGELCCVGCGLDQLIYTDFVKTHRDPFRIEAWTVMADGRRVAGRSVALLWQLILQQMLSGLRSRWIF